MSNGEWRGNLPRHSHNIVSGMFLLLYLYNLILLNRCRQHFALDVDLCHLGLGIAVHRDTCPELTRSALFTIEDYDD